MMPDPNIFTVVRAEQELRIREAERFWRAAYASSSRQGRTARVSLRVRIGGAVVTLGERLRGTTPPLADGLGRVAG